MKKLIALSILFTVLSAAAFAQFQVGLEGKWRPDLLKATAPLGDNANKEKSAYQGVGTFDFFSTSDFACDSDLDLNLKYTGADNKYAGLFQLNLKGLVRRGAGFLEKNDDPNVSIATILGYLVGDWYAWGTAGIFTGYVGNTNDNKGRGYVDRYANFTDFSDAWHMDNYGIILPINADGTYGFRQVDSNNVGRFKAQNATFTSTNNGSVPHFSVLTDLGLVKVNLAGDLTNFAGHTDNGKAEPLNSDGTLSHSAIGGALRVSAVGLADIVTLDAIYKIKGFDPNTEDKLNGSFEPDGKGGWGNNFGIFANLNLIDVLGIGVGYSGYFNVREDSKEGDITYKYRLPYYNGIDLRFNFTGVDKLTVTFNNNFSFSAVTGDDDDNTRIASLYGSVDNLNNSKLSSGYFGMYNGLLAKFALSDPLIVSFELINYFSALNYTNKIYDEIKADRLADIFTAALGAEYTVGHVTLGTGLVFNVNHTTTTVTNGNDDQNTQGGTFTFAIPIKFKIVF